MEFSKFKEMIHSNLQEMVPDDVEVSVINSTKNNSIEYTGFMFRTRDGRVSPAIYIDGYYTRYMEHSLGLDECCDKIYETYTQSLNMMGSIDPDMKFDFESCKDNIIIRLVSYKKNVSVLKDIPYIKFLDMAVVFYVMVGKSEDYLQSLKVTNDLMKKWNIDINSLFDLAKSNTMRLFPVKTHDLYKYMEMILLNEQSDIREEIGDNDSKIKMIIVTNSLGINGATVLVYDNIIDELANKYDSDLVILPSSIHEIIVVVRPESEEFSDEYFSTLVNQVNVSAVDPEEVLSDHAYFYDRRIGAYR